MKLINQNIQYIFILKYISLYEIGPITTITSEAENRCAGMHILFPPLFPGPLVQVRRVVMPLLHLPLSATHSLE